MQTRYEVRGKRLCRHLCVSLYVRPLSKDLRDELIANNFTATDVHIYGMFLHYCRGNLKTHVAEGGDFGIRR